MDSGRRRRTTGGVGWLGAHALSARLGRLVETRLVVATVGGSRCVLAIGDALAENTGCWIANLSLSHIRPVGSTSRAREMSGGIGRYT